MIKLKSLIILLSILILFSSFIYANQKEMKRLEGKKILMIIGSKDFRDEELLEPKKIFEDEGAKVIIASSTLEPIKGMLGKIIKADILIDDVKVDDYDAIIFVGGIGAKEYWENTTAHKIAKEAIEKDKKLGAICLAPVILAKAGVLKDKKATVWKSERRQLTDNGAQYTGKYLEVDGNIITADGPESARYFGLAILDALLKPEK